MASLFFLQSLGSVGSLDPRYHTLAHVSRNYSAVELSIVEDANKILMVATELKQVYSRWDKRNHRALSPYGHTMAGEVRSQFSSVTRKRSANQNVLMLGLGGGVIAGDLLCNASAPNNMRVTAVELVASVASLAERRFFGAMFSGRYAPLRDRLRVVVGDAMKPQEVVGAHERYAAILLDIPPVYEAVAGTPAAYLETLRGMSVPHGILVINTLYETKEEAFALERMLTAARWQHVRKKLVGRATWAPRSNVIISAVRDGGSARGVLR